MRRRNLRENRLGSDPIERRLVDGNFLHSQIVGIDNLQKHLSGFDERRFCEIPFTGHRFRVPRFQFSVSSREFRFNRKPVTRNEKLKKYDFHFFSLLQSVLVHLDANHAVRFD